MNHLSRLAVNVALMVALTPSAEAGAAVPISLHPSNGHYFSFRGRPTVLVTSAEHYGAVLNLDFEYVAYLDALRADGLNYTRIFTGGTYVEVAGAFNIEKNTLAPASGQFLAPYARSSTPGYAGGGNKFDLSSWDTAYFARLKDFIEKAGKRGIVVEVTLFCPYYEDSLWGHSPLYPSNNVNGTQAIGKDQMYTMSSPYLSYHDALTQKFAVEVNAYDNVFFEICNEPYFGGVTLEWQAHIARTITAAEAGLPKKHLIAQNIANNSAVISSPDASISIFNFHYCRPPDAVAQNAALGKVIGFDETGFDGSADLTYRVQAWNFILAGGALYNNLDYSFTTAREDGTDAQSAPGGGSSALRKELGILKRLLDSLPFVDMAAANSLIKGVPSGASARVLAKAGVAYLVYLEGGSQGELAIELATETYRIEWIDTKTGEVVSSMEMAHAGGEATLVSPPYTDDLALSIVRISGAGR